MTKFQDLDQKHQSNLALNLRVQTLMAKFISESEGISAEEVIASFRSKAMEDVSSLSEEQIIEYLAMLDNLLEGKFESKVSLN